MLNITGISLVDRLQLEGATRQELVATILEQFEISEDHSPDRDVDDFLAELQVRGFLAEGSK